MGNSELLEIIKIQSEIIHFLSEQIKSLKTLAPLEAEKLRILRNNLDEKLKEM